MLDAKGFIESIKLRNFLSYGPSADENKLISLNVLIGSNSSGKSNLIEALGILRAAPMDLTEPIREGGGIGEWLWKGSKQKTPAEIAVTLKNPSGQQSLRYRLSFTMVGQRFELIDESLENKDRVNPFEEDVYFFYRYQNGFPVLNVQDTSQTSSRAPTGPKLRHLKREDLDPSQSVLSQRKDPDQYPELTYVANQFSKMRMYREWDLGRYTPPRLPQKPDLPQDFLLEDAKNLVLVLNSLEHKSGAKRVLLDRLKNFYRGIEDFTVKIEGGTVQLFLHERGLREPVPATRLSDGTLRYLCMLTILCHPTPPPVVCIEEPELGLHPDALKSIAELLVDASQRTQLIVTTHSETLVSHLNNVPESILVCERDEDGTKLRRLDKDRLKEWLQQYNVGELWRMGEIGGNP
ncbi:MAG: AAA family ATPase [Chloroflexi bacterium]|nr:AAA family ATPase [Chloroflexota bacterium]